jgi:phage shock protein A
MIPAEDSDLSGLDQDAAKEYILAHIIQIKLNEKETAAMEAEAATWQERAALAAGKGESGLAGEAETRAAALRDKAAAIRGETRTLQAVTERMLRRFPALNAGKRSVDPDLLLQELLIAAGRDPGSEAELALEQRLTRLSDDAAAEEALAALKKKAAGGDGSP